MGFFEKLKQGLEKTRAGFSEKISGVLSAFTRVDEDLLEELEEALIPVSYTHLGIDIPLPLPRLTWQQAMDRYGSDKPDTRFGMELTDLSDIAKDCGFKVFAEAVKNGGSVRAIKAEQADLSRKEIDALGEFVKTYGAKGLAWMNLKAEGLNSPIAKFLSEQEITAILERTQAKTGDVLFFVADTNKVVYAALGALRLELAKRLSLIPENQWNLLWVTEFPQFEYSEEEGRLVAMHHPFTSPMDEDLDLLETAPEKVRAKAYDIVLNGTELGGGSIRIHDSALQERMFRALGFTKEQAWERFGFMMQAFQYGTPPHGGLAYGLDRLAMLLSGSQSLRDVIAFPKVQNASDLMCEAPDLVDEKQLTELGIAVLPEEE